MLQHERTKKYGAKSKKPVIQEHTEKRGLRNTQRQQIHSNGEEVEDCWSWREKVGRSEDKSKSILTPKNK